MTDSINQAGDDLDANWDDANATSESIAQSRPPAPELAQIDAGWEHDGNTARALALSMGPSSPSIVPESGALPKTLETIDEGWDLDGPSGSRANSTATVGKLTVGKKERRELERRARAHQFERSLETRQQRKAKRREESNQRAKVDSPDRQLTKAAKKQRSQAKRSRDLPDTPSTAGSTRQAAKSSGKAAPSNLSTQPTGAIGSGPNRAQRRAKGFEPTIGRNEPSLAPPVAPSKKYFIGPFALFIGVVLLASLLSYAVIR